MATATRTRTSTIAPEIPAWPSEEKRRPRPLRPVRTDRRPSPEPPPAPARRRFAGWVMAVAWIELAAALELIRISGTAPWRSVWAEDAGFFLPEAVTNPLGTLFKTHAGYFQFVSRALGSLASLFPLEHAAVIFAVGGAVIAAVLSVYVYRVSDAVLRTTWARGLVAALMVLTPATVFEVSDSGVDLHWYFLFAAFWALWSVSKTRWRVVADAVVVGVAAMSSPLTVLFAPIALRRVIADRGWGQWLVPTVFATGVGAQAIYRLGHPMDSKFTEVNVANVRRFLGLRVVASNLVGDGLLKESWQEWGWSLVFVAAAVTVVVLVCGLMWGRGRRLFIVTCAAYAAGLTVASLLLRGTGNNIVPGGPFDLGGSRYTFVPIMVLTTMFIAVADMERGWRWLRVVPALLVFGAAAANAAAPTTVREKAPDWPKAVAEARKTCRTAPPDQLVALPGAPDGWKSSIACRRVLQR